MEQVIFLHSDEASEEVLSQVQRSLAQRLVLVAPVPLDRLRLSMLLRLVRRYAAARPQQLCLVSEDHLLRVLAERMGYAVANTLDAHRGLTPGNAASVRKHIQPPPTAQLSSSRPLPPHPGQRAPANIQRPGARLESMLVDGYLPNPAATPSLEEDEERAEREEPVRLHYEVADETYRSQAQQEAEEHEARIIATILKTSTLGSGNTPVPAPAHLTDREAREEQSSLPPEDESDERDDGDTPPAPSAPGGGIVGSPENGQTEQSPTGVSHPSPPTSLVEVLEDPLSRPGAFEKAWEGRLRPMRTIDELLAERGHTDVFEWFAHQAIGQHVGQQGAGGSSDQIARLATRMNASSAARAGTRPTPPARSSAPPSALRATSRHLAPPVWAIPSSLQRTLALLHQARSTLWRRIVVGMTLALSFLMVCLGFSLIPSAEVSYRITTTPYSETVILEAEPPGFNQSGGFYHTPLVPAEIARFDGVLTAEAPATGRRPIPASMQETLAFPTQGDVDHLANLLRAQLLALGQRALQAQQAPGDLLGQAVPAENITSFPAVNSTLPEGASYFQVSLALHLRAALIRHQALVQAIQNQVNQDVGQIKPGEALAAGQPLTLGNVAIEPAGAGAAMLALWVRVPASGMIGPAITPEQVRSTLAGMPVADAEAYLRSLPGIADVSITIQPKWLNRLPIFSARIRINLER